MIVVALIGMPGSGKGEASEVFRKNGYTAYYMNSVFKKELKRRGLEYNVENVGMAANELRQLEGMGAVAKRLAPEIKAERSCIEGVRSLYEIEEFRKFFPDIVVVSIDSPPELRFKRAKARGRTDDIKSYEEFLKKDAREAAWGVRQGIENADYKVLNDGTIGDFRRKVLDVLKGLEE
ncbi:MAG: AAA family ATPase [archaeon]